MMIVRRKRKRTIITRKRIRNAYFDDGELAEWMMGATLDDKGEPDK